MVVAGEILSLECISKGLCFLSCTYYYCTHDIILSPFIFLAIYVAKFRQTELYTIPESSVSSSQIRLQTFPSENFDYTVP